MTRHLLLVADDYGIAPGVDDGILELLAMGRLSGTGCMTLFADWRTEAARLAPFEHAAIGLHLTLTDQIALSGTTSLAREGRLPRLAALAVRQAARDADIFAELDLQLGRFVQAFGRPPAYIDGHQHVHLLKPVRRWLIARFGAATARPVLRGVPRPSLTFGTTAAKALAIRAMGRGFEGQMAEAGFALLRPLEGLYDLGQPSRFPSVLDRAVATMSRDGVFMCHPGRVDDVLRGRDPLQATREAELADLASDRFADSLSKADAQVRRGL